MYHMEFKRPPSVWWCLIKAIFARKKGCFTENGLSRFEANISLKPSASLSNYQSLCGFPETRVLPVTYPHVLAGPLHLALGTHKNFPLPAMGLVHASNTITQHREIMAEEELDIRCWIDGSRQIGIGVEMDINTQVLVAGELVWESISTIVSRAVPGDGLKRDRPARPALEMPKSESWRLSGNLGRRYASLSKDYNPIHMFATLAKMFGFRSQIAHGMFLLGKVASKSSVCQSGAVKLSVVFQRPVFLPSTTMFRIGGSENNEVFDMTAKSGKVQIHGIAEVLNVSGK